MLRKKLLKKLGLAFLLLLVLNEPAVFLHLYNLIWWFDMPMHFLGGLSVFYLSAVIWLPALKYVSYKRFLYESVITAVLIGVLWEALELFLFTHLGTPTFFLTDSISDVIFDFAGALFGAFTVLPLFKSRV
jgi:VanZ family protein